MTKLHLVAEGQNLKDDINCITFQKEKAYQEVVDAVDMHRRDLEEREARMEVLCHFALQDGCHLEAAGRRTLVEHNPLDLEEEMVDLGGGKALSVVADKNVLGLE
jgi:formiminotetrahydrofolate cyclodeaminase